MYDYKNSLNNKKLDFRFIMVRWDSTIINIKERRSKRKMVDSTIVNAVIVNRILIHNK